MIVITSIYKYLDFVFDTTNVWNIVGASIDFKWLKSEQTTHAIFNIENMVLLIQKWNALEPKKKQHLFQYGSEYCVLMWYYHIRHHFMTLIDMSKNPYIRELSSISSRHMSSNSRQISNISRQPSSFSRRLSGNSRQLSLEDLFLTPQFLSQLSARQQSIVGLKRVDIRYSASGSRRDGHFMKVIKKKVAPVEKETTAPATTVTHDKRYRVLYVFVADAIWRILLLWMNFLFI